MNGNITIDGAGRIVIPKLVREQLHLQAGDSLELESGGDTITLRPVRPKVSLKKEYGVWVYQGEPADVSIMDVIDRAREDRIRQIIK